MNKKLRRCEKCNKLFVMNIYASGLMTLCHKDFIDYIFSNIEGTGYFSYCELFNEDKILVKIRSSNINQLIEICMIRYPDYNCEEYINSIRVSQGL